MTTAITSDRCRSCGASIYSGEGCPFNFLCDDCCKQAGHKHRKGLTTMQYLTEFLRGIIGRFRRNPDGSLECLGLARKEDGAQIVKMMQETSKENARVVKAAADSAPQSQFTRLGEGEVARGSTLSGMAFVVTENSAPPPTRS